MERSISYRFAFFTLTLLFFMWGFITVMNDVLINTFKDIFALSNFASGLVQFSFFGAFFVVSLLYFFISRTHGDPINRIGYKNGMAAGLALCGLGCVLFYPASQADTYMPFLGALFVLAAGVALLQIAANPYAAILGTPETSSSRLNFAQGFNSLGTTLGPIVGALLIFMVFSGEVLSAVAIGKTYFLYGCIFIAMAILVSLLRMPGFQNKERKERGWGALRYPQLRFGMVAIFAYVGAEVAIGSWLVSFGMEPNVLGFDKATGNRFLSWYWGGLMIGRLLGAISLSGLRPALRKTLFMVAVSLAAFGLIFIATGVEESGGNFSFSFHGLETVALFLVLMAFNFVAFLYGRSKAGRTLMIFALVNVGLLWVAVCSSGSMAFWALVGTGLFNSIMWSNVFTLSIRGLGSHTSQGSSLLIMSVVGGALLPPLQGLLADYVGMQWSFLMPVLPYVYLAWFGFYAMRNASLFVDGLDAEVKPVTGH
jgi:FHS family L-fucose permease-like MFS transporter